MMRRLMELWRRLPLEDVMGSATDKRLFKKVNNYEAKNQASPKH